MSPVRSQRDSVNSGAEDVAVVFCAWLSSSTELEVGAAQPDAVVVDEVLAGDPLVVHIVPLVSQIIDAEAAPHGRDLAWRPLMTDP